MPALFLARHYIELSLKDEIINVSIATGSNFIIGSKGNHSLIELSHSFKKLLEDNYLNILHSKFFDIVETIAKLSPKSDEFRYTIDVKGKYHLPISFTDDNDSPNVINLMVLCQYLNYIYLRLYSLFFILEDDEESLFAETAFENPYVKGLLYGIVHSNISKKLDQSPKEKIIPEIENCVYSVIANNNLKIQSKDIKVCKSGNGYQILRNCQKLFIIFKDNDSWYLKTQPVIK